MVNQESLLEFMLAMRTILPFGAVIFNLIIFLKNYHYHYTIRYTIGYTIGCCASFALPIFIGFTVALFLYQREENKKNHFQSLFNQQGKANQ